MINSGFPSLPSFLGRQRRDFLWNRQAVAAPTNDWVKTFFFFFKFKVFTKFQFMIYSKQNVFLKKEEAYDSWDSMYAAIERVQLKAKWCKKVSVWVLGESRISLLSFCKYLCYSQKQALTHALTSIRKYETFEHVCCNRVQVLELPPVVWQDFTVERCVVSVSDCVRK